MTGDRLDRLAKVTETGRKRLHERLASLAGETGPSGRLTAVVTGADGKSIDVDALRRLCEKKLPAFMVPQQFIQLEELPKTPAGKVDRPALAAMASSTATEPAAAGVVAPRNEVEETLAGIWREVLGVDEISIHDNFFEIGGDSLLIIRILSRAARVNLSMTPDAFFAHPTIAEQAGIVSAASSVRAETGVITGGLPLLPVQHWFFGNVTVDPHHWNLSYLFELRAAVSGADIGRMVHKLLQQHDSLRSRFTIIDGEWRAEITGVGTEPPLTSLDVSGMDGAERRTAIESIAAKLNGDFDLSVAPLVRFAHFVTGGSGPDYLLVVAHHLVVDAESWRVMVSDLGAMASQLAAGRAPSLPPKATSIVTWSNRLLEFANSPAFEKQLGFWRDYLRKPVPSIPFDRRAAPGDNIQGAARDLESELGREATAALQSSGGASLRVGVNVMLLSALARVVAAWSDASDVMFDMEGHGREPLFDDLDISRTAGWFTTVFPVVLRAPDPDVWRDPIRSLKLVKEQVQGLPQNGFGYGLAHYLQNDRPSLREHACARAEILFNYLGRDDDGDTSLRLVDDRCGPARSDRCERPYLLEINAKIAGGKLRLTWTFNEAIHSRATVAGLAGKLIELLEELAGAASREEDAATPSDFPLAGLSQQELDQLSEQLDALDGD